MPSEISGIRREAAPKGKEREATRRQRGKSARNRKGRGGGVAFEFGRIFPKKERQLKLC